MAMMTVTTLSITLIISIIRLADTSRATHSYNHVHVSFRKTSVEAQCFFIMSDRRFNDVRKNIRVGTNIAVNENMFPALAMLWMFSR